MKLTTYILKIWSSVSFCMGMTKRYKPQDGVNMTVGSSRLNNYTDLHLEFQHPWLMPAFNVWGNKHIILYGIQGKHRNWTHCQCSDHYQTTTMHPSQFSHKFEYLLRNLTYIIEFVSNCETSLIRPLSCGGFGSSEQAEWNESSLSIIGFKLRYICKLVELYIHAHPLALKND